MSDNKKTKLNYMVVIPSKEYEPGNTPVEGPEDFDYTEQAEEVLSNAENIKPSTARKVVTTAIDIGTPILGGAIIGNMMGNKAVKRVTENKGEDNVANAIEAGIVASSEKQTGKLKKKLEENKKVAKDFAEGKTSPKKALKKILDNSKFEAAIGPDYKDDIQVILEKEANLSDKQINKIFKDWLEKNKESPDLIHLIEAKDPNYTFGHSVRVARLTKDLALKAGLSPERAEALEQAALLHDMGKVATQQRVLDSSDIFPQTHSGREAALYNHDIWGKEILESTDPLAARLAESHHPLHGRTETSGLEDKLVTIADLYDAISGARSYKGSKSKQDTLDIIEKSNIPKGETTKEFLDLLLQLDKDNKLNEFYPVESDLSEAFTAMKKNALENIIRNQYIKKGIMYGAGYDVLQNLDKGGVADSSLPSITDIVEEFSPSSRDKKELIDDINRWYERGNFDNNPEAIKAIANTDFSKAKEVRKLWKDLYKISNNPN